MRQFIDVTGKTEDEAIQNALRQLGLDRDDVSVEILERAKSGFLGLGSCPAKVRVSYGPEEEEEVLAPAPAPKEKPQEERPKPPKAEKPPRQERKPAEAPAPAPEEKTRQSAPVQTLGEEVDDEKAQAIGCVNTLVCRDGRLMGYNTDFDGLSYCLDRAGISLQGKRLLILGSGSTSLTVRAVAKARGVAEITVVSRAGEVNYENVYDRTDPQVIINATPVGMWPNVTGRPVDLRRFAHLEAVADVVYNPLRTELVLQAEELGLPVTGGLPMLVVQSLYAALQFCGRTFPQE